MKLNVIAALVLAAPAVLANPPADPHRNMDCLLGSWKGAGSVTLGKDTAPITMTWDCQPTSAQHGVLCKAVMKGIPGVAEYSETDLFGYEPNSNTYHWFSVTNGGETHDHVAPFSTGNKIRFVYKGTAEGKSFHEVIDMTFSDDQKAVTLRGETFSGGKSMSVIQGTLRK